MTIGLDTLNTLIRGKILAEKSHKEVLIKLTRDGLFTKLDKPNGSWIPVDMKVSCLLSNEYRSYTGRPMDHDEAVKNISYWGEYGHTPKEILDAYIEAVGKWYKGFWKPQSVEIDNICRFDHGYDAIRIIQASLDEDIPDIRDYGFGDTEGGIAICQYIILRDFGEVN